VGLLNIPIIDNYINPFGDFFMPKSPSGIMLRGLSIERGSAVPMYKQLEAGLRRLILNGTLQAAQKLPSTPELASYLGVSRITVKSVYEQLVAEGYA
jgi:GntR family transcriptional regulator/MocR family aminotransferase